MDIIQVNKALSNQTRLDIFKWLKNPGDNFPPHKELGHFDFGVCVQLIQERANLSQSTISHYLSLMENAGLVVSTRIGKWTYYKRNEETVKKYAQLILGEL